MILKENLFQGTPNRGPPPSPLQQNPGVNSIFSLKPSTSGSVTFNIPALNDFFLYPQAVPSRISTRLFGPLPPQTFSLLFGQSSLASKGFTVHPGIIDSDYKGEIQIMMSSQILWQFKKGDKIVQLRLLPSVQFSSVAQLCPTLCNPMNCSMPGLPVHHQPPEFTQTHVHQVGDAIQPSHPLSSPSHPAPNPSQHQSLCQ